MRWSGGAIALAVGLLLAQGALAVGTESDTSGNPEYDAAKALIDAERFEEAIPRLRAAVLADPDSADVFNLLGFAHRKTGKWDDALAFYKRALAIEPKHVGANEYLGELYLEQGKVELAEERLDVLLTACGRCEEYKELAELIEQYRAVN